jgi:hypothetical protein
MLTGPGGNKRASATPADVRVVPMHGPDIHSLALRYTARTVVRLVRSQRFSRIHSSCAKRGLDRRSQRNDE